MMFCCLVVCCVQDYCHVPSVIVDIIMHYILDGIGMTRQEAMDNRLILMNERSQDVTTQNQQWEKVTT